MTDSGEGKRPNANYKLSKENPDPLVLKDGEEKLTFYYNRQRRLEKASPIVRKLYEQPNHKFNLLKPLIDGKARSTIFFTIVIFCIVIVMLSLMGFMSKTYSLQGNKLEINATIIEDVTLIVLKKTISTKEPYTGEINIGVSPITKTQNEEEYPVYTHKIFFTMQEEERFSFSVPFNSQELAVVFQTEKSELKVTIKPE